MGKFQYYKRVKSHWGWFYFCALSMTSSGTWRAWRLETLKFKVKRSFLHSESKLSFLSKSQRESRVKGLETHIVPSHTSWCIYMEPNLSSYSSIFIKYNFNFHLSLHNKIGYLNMFLVVITLPFLISMHANEAGRILHEGEQELMNRNLINQRAFVGLQCCFFTRLTIKGSSSSIWM